MSRGFRLGWFLAPMVLLVAFCPSVSLAQFQNAGVEIQADGVLRIKRYEGLNGGMVEQWRAAAQTKLGRDISRVAEKRKISLNRLEAAIAAKLAAGADLTEEMKYLAGLTRIENVFLYPASGDVVIAGPAEGWSLDTAGRVVGIHSGHATLELQDLVVALRAFPAGQDTRTELIGCSIDPTKEGLAKMAQFFNNAARNFTPGRTAELVAGMKENLGLQNVTINGVHPQTHFAQVLVEADYRMKLIGIGLEPTPTKIVSYVSKARPGSNSNNSLQRWYFQPNYECVRVTEDMLAMQLVGEGVKLSNQSELVGADGSRAGGGAKDAASEAFVTSFTTNYAALANKVPVYAQLRNLIDMTIAAAFLQEQDYYGKAGWTPKLLLDEERVKVQVYPAPTQVESAVNAVWKGNHLMTPIGGGVSIRARHALTKENLLPDDQGKLQATRAEVKVDGLAEGQWWWD